MDHLPAFLAYLRAYAAKDLPAIGAMLAPDVRLRDWNLSVAGRDAVLAETAKNFAAAQRLHIDVLATYACAEGVAGELKVTVDGTLELFVVDVLQFDEAGQIVAIRAYLGRPD